MAFVHPANRSHIAVIASIRDANMLQTQRLSQRRIKTYPARIRQVNFSPGMGCGSPDNFLQFGVGRRRAFGNQVPGDISRGQASFADHSQQQVREILADPRADASESWIEELTCVAPLTYLNFSWIKADACFDKS